RPLVGPTLCEDQRSIPISPSLQKNLPYDPVRDFAPISKIASYMFFLVVHPSLPVRSVKQLIVLAKSKPGEINYASVGIGSGTHLAGELFNYLTGVKMMHIPYKGTGQVMPDLLGGQVAVHFGSTSVVPYVKARKLTALGVTGAQRSPALPEIPTIAEAGVPGFEVTGSKAPFSPPRRPAPTLTHIL